MKKQAVLTDARKGLQPIPYRVFEYLLDRLIVEGLPVTYEPVGRHVGLPWQHDSLGSPLAEVSDYTFETFGFMMSAMVHVSGMGEPGNGFPLWAWNEHDVRINSPLWYQQELDRMVKWARALQ